MSSANGEKIIRDVERQLLNTGDLPLHLDEKRLVDGSEKKTNMPSLGYFLYTIVVLSVLLLSFVSAVSNNNPR